MQEDIQYGKKDRKVEGHVGQKGVKAENMVEERILNEKRNKSQRHTRTLGRRCRKTDNRNERKACRTRWRADKEQ